MQAVAQHGLTYLITVQLPFDLVALNALHDTDSVGLPETSGSDQPPGKHCCTMSSAVDNGGLYVTFSLQHHLSVCVVRSGSTSCRTLRNHLGSHTEGFVSYACANSRLQIQTVRSETLTIAPAQSDSAHARKS